MLGMYLVTKRNWRARSLFRIFIQKTLNQCLCLRFHLHAMFLWIGESECTITDPFEKCHPSSTNICNNINEKRISSCSSESNVNSVKNRLTYERSLANKHFINYYPGVQIWCCLGLAKYLANTLKIEMQQTSQYSHPSAKWSTLQLWPFPSKISGAMYSGEPHVVYDLSCTTLAKPKSTRTTYLEKEPLGDSLT